MCVYKSEIRTCSQATDASRQKCFAADKRTWETFAELLDGCGLLLFSNLFVFLLVGGRLETLPGEAAAKKVHEDVAQSLEVVSSGLLATEVGVDGHVSSGAGERFALAVRDVLLGFGVSVLLGHAKVDDVNEGGVLGACAAGKEVVWLDVSIDEVLFVYALNSRQLVGKRSRKARFQCLCFGRPCPRTLPFVWRP